MKRLLLAAALTATNAHAMTDAAALTKVRERLGAMATIMKVRVGTKWRYKLAANTPLCAHQITEFADSEKSWEDVFAKLLPSVVIGPLSGKVTLKATAFDDRGVASLRWVLNGVYASPELQATRQQTFTATFVWDTAAVPDGIYTLCAEATDTWGHKGSNPAVVVRLSQAEKSVVSELTWGNGVKTLFSGTGR